MRKSYFLRVPSGTNGPTVYRFGGVRFASVITDDRPLPGKVRPRVFVTFSPPRDCVAPTRESFRVITNICVSRYVRAYCCGPGRAPTFRIPAGSSRIAAEVRSVRVSPVRRRININRRREVCLTVSEIPAGDTGLID